MLNYKLTTRSEYSYVPSLYSNVFDSTWVIK